MTYIDRAQTLCEQMLLEQLPRRYSHVLGVGSKAKSVGVALGLGVGLDLFQAAGMLHDVGYSPGLATAQFHPLDGARFLKSEGWDEDLVNLVANHSCATIEADVRGLGDELHSEFPKNPDLPHDELCYCDMTVGPSGKPVTIEHRLSDIRSRYEKGSIVDQFLDLAEPELKATVKRVSVRIESP